MSPQPLVGGEEVNAHGPGEYRWGCGCDTCLDHRALRLRQRRAERAIRIAADPSLAVHGRNETYKNWGCKCTECTEAHRIAFRAWYAGRGQ